MLPKTLIDSFGRTVDYIRVSVTDRCDFRCVYCMAEHMTFLPKAELLSLEELEQVCRNFMALGTRKIRLTGGEPLVRRNIMHLIRNLGSEVKAGNLDELTITTNGSQLHKMADELVDAGVKRLNISIDTLDPDRFREITRWGDLDNVLEGLEAAKRAGLAIKLNAVALKGVNEFDLGNMVAWAGDQGFDMTIIEVMPMGDIGNENRLNQYWPLSDLRKKLSETWTLNDTDEQTGGPARYVRLNETGQKIGFITPMTHNFCESCNRVRLTCTGELYICLGQEDQVDLRKILRNHSDTEPLIQAIHNAISKKPKGHDFDYSRQSISGQMTRHMSHTGG